MPTPLRSRRRDPHWTTQSYFDALEESVLFAREQLRKSETTTHLALLRLGGVLTELDCLRAHLNRHGHEAVVHEEE